jgi:hypothetical protein
VVSPSYPASLDALANPGPTTETDDAGFELDIVIARIQNCIMAVEHKLGTGAGDPPASAAVLRRTATGASAWGQVATADIAAGAVTQALYLTKATALAVGGTAWAVDNDLAQSITTTGGYVVAFISTTMYVDVAPANVRIAVWRADAGVAYGQSFQYFPTVSNGYAMFCQAIDHPAAGTYTYQLAVQNAAPGNIAHWFPDGARSLVLLELKR